MPAIEFDLTVRTSSSARWAIMLDTVEVGSVDLHIEGPRARATVAVRATVDDDTLDEVIEQFDEHKVPPEHRVDLQVTVWRGELLGVFGPAE